MQPLQNHGAATKLQVSDVRAGYQPDTDIVKGVSVTAEPGKVTTLIGPNGCGKSTLLKTMSRLLTPTAGSVSLVEQAGEVGATENGSESVSVHSLAPREAAKRIAMLAQHPTAPAGLSVGEVVARGRHPYKSWFQGESAADKAAIDAAIERTDIGALVNRDIAALSGGQRQRVWLAMALAQDTPVLLLDEPTTYLDPAHSVDMLQLVQQLARDGKTVVMVLHDLMLAGAFSDQLVVMKDGSIITTGAPTKALTVEVLQQAYGLVAEVWEDPKGIAPVIVPRGSALTGAILENS